MSDEFTLTITKEDLLGLIKEAYTQGHFGYLDLCENSCLEIMNKLLEEKIKKDKFAGNVDVVVGNKIKVNGESIGYIGENFQYDWSSNFFTVSTT